jgi:hypothetical protein
MSDLVRRGSRKDVPVRYGDTQQARRQPIVQRCDTILLDDLESSSLGRLPRIIPISDHPLSSDAQAGLPGCHASQRLASGWIG